MIVRSALAFWVALIAPTTASGDDAADFMDALGKAATAAIVAEAYLSACDARFPDSQQARQDALAGWGHRVDLAGYERLIASAAMVMPDLDEDLEANRARAKALVDDDVAKDSSVCGDLRATLDDNDMFDIARPIRYLLRNADSFGIVVAEAPTEVTSPELEVVSLIALSAELAAKMDEIGSKSGAEQDRDLREARQNHAENWLALRPALAINGRITSADTLREWRGDQQSTFLASCRSFASDEQEATMARDIGAERVVIGQIRWLREDREGGELSLDDCRVLDDSQFDNDRATVADESRGLMLRPLDYAEAYGAPGAGIVLSDIDRVLYDAEFANRMDGFGNGYTQRDEDIYVLLRDGTAYRHAWNFAFTDLNLDLSRQREPDRWFTWKDEADQLMLTQSGGLDVGSTIDISEAKRLMPVPEGQVLNATYYLLNVGMGGVRSDREYAFLGDGQLRYSRSGFVAGSFGTSYIIASGKRAYDVATGAYSFDGYTLLIQGPEGEERHFVALIEGHDADRPQEIILDGQVYWMRTNEQ